ncbi:SAM-dependent methyltransferase [Actinoplanes sp. NBRC 103695]|uniref:SAM-dependent methyltransferase n=1 Tax=Actinoplanes sp. NBRC 103695 TaxID=3032202 RepID=UPI002554A3E5|nr:SAM-dependent methyltransferase [Actinoplanes sp. NBRC 103695]
MTTTPPGIPADDATAPADKIDVTVPHPARRYDYWLGGKDNFAADRESGDRIAEAYPDIVTSVRENRRYMHRVVRYLAAEAGITQFLDVGTGIPTEPNVHQIAQGITPAARVVYVDNDPLVMVHNRALMIGTPEGVTGYVEGDLRDPGRILANSTVHDTFDFGKPIAVLLIAVLHFLDDDQQAYSIMSELVDRLPPGSYVAISQATYDPLPEETLERLRVLAERGKDGPFRPRTRNEFEKFFNGLSLVDPGVCSLVDWRPDLIPSPQAGAEAVAAYGAVARIDTGQRTGS